VYEEEGEEMENRVAAETQLSDSFVRPDTLQPRELETNIEKIINTRRNWQEY
jgi:hypothetical protein